MADSEGLSFRSRSEIDGFLQTPRFNKDASPFWYKSWRRINPHIRAERDTPVVNPSYGGNIMVELDKDKSRVGEMWFITNRSALTGQGSATFSRFQDFEGYAMWQEIEIHHSDGLINRSNDEHMWIEHRTMDDDDQVVWGEHLVFGDLPAANRNVLGAAAQTVYSKVFNPADKDPRLYFGVQSLGSKIFLRAIIRPLNQITETDGTASPLCTINTLNLRTYNYHFTQAEKNAHNRRTKGAGMRFRVQEYSPLKLINIATGVESTQVEYELRGLTGAASEFIMMIYDTANRDHVAANATNERYVFQTISEFEGHIASTRVIPPQSNIWNKHVTQRRFYRGTIGDNIYRYPWSENIADPIGIWGHQGLSQSHPLKVRITFDSTAVVNTWELRAYVLRNQFFKHQNSKYSRIVH